jgi:phage baseplate assembly protein gpV
MQNDILAIMGMAQQQAIESAMQILHGTVDSYDPSNCTVRVKLEPEGVLTGDMQMLQPWTGNDYGIQCGPEKGMQVMVLALDQNREQLICLPGRYNDKLKAPGAPAGEMWIKHKSGTFLKLRNNGDVEIKAAGKIREAATEVILNTDLNDLSDADSIVRKADLQALITYLNTVWKPAMLNPVGSYLAFGVPTPPNPAFVAALLPIPPATASSVGKAKG